MLAWLSETDPLPCDLRPRVHTDQRYVGRTLNVGMQKLGMRCTSPRIQVIRNMPTGLTGFLNVCLITHIGDSMQLSGRWAIIGDEGLLRAARDSCC